MLPLPTEKPKWYTVEEDRNENYKGWTPKTSDITSKPENREITAAWTGTYDPPSPKNYTVKINKLRVVSPIQVGGGSFPEGGTLPAQVNGVPCVPGASTRGAFLSWLRKNWSQFPLEEQQFWSSLISEDGQSWQPKTIRFETILLKDLKPFPLNAQQLWQVFDHKDNKLGIQWQVSPKHPPNPDAADKFDLHIIIKPTPSQEQKKWVENRLKEFLKQQGIGRGTASGFGRLANTMPKGKWEIELIGMKPCVQPHNPNNNVKGQYRWSPQVLRANLRSYFTRLALAWLSPESAKALTDKIFGGFGSPARLVLTSYLRSIGRSLQNQGDQRGYTNIPAQDAHSVWKIPVECNEELQDLVGDLLELSSRLGGLGPGWRRPPHKLESFGGFRGSQFHYTPNQPSITHGDLIQRLYKRVKSLAQAYHYQLFSTPQTVKGGLNSIWEGDGSQWRNIVHGICSSKNQNKPAWCGSSNHRPSGYAVRQYEDHCLVTVFDPEVEATLRSEEFRCIWQVSS
ncbi:MAG: RAMP superfamily CRISPR-associated protein [Halothece sp.]